MLFRLANDDSMLCHYTLADDDLEIIHARRRPHNRFGFALQLCTLRYPGRLLAPGEVISLPVIRFLAAQLGTRPDNLADYAAREETRHWCCQTNANLSQFSRKSRVLCSTKLLPLLKCRTTLKFKLISGV